MNLFWFHVLICHPNLSWLTSLLFMPAVVKDSTGPSLNYHQLEANVVGFWRVESALITSVKLCRLLDHMELMLVVASVLQMEFRKTSLGYRPSWEQ